MFSNVPQEMIGDVISIYVQAIMMSSNLLTNMLPLR